ncbi:MAG: hypothetical protein WC683_05185 [bacterium]
MAAKDYPFLEKRKNPDPFLLKKIHEIEQQITRRKAEISERREEIAKLEKEKKALAADVDFFQVYQQAGYAVQTIVRDITIRKEGS